MDDESRGGEVVFVEVLEDGVEIGFCGCETGGEGYEMRGGSVDDVVVEVLIDLSVFEELPRGGSVPA